MWLFLDDERNPSDVTWMNDSRYQDDKQWTIVRNYDDFVNIVENCGIPKMISFDHDLSDEHYMAYFDLVKYEDDDPDKLTLLEKTGYTCAKWLVDFCDQNRMKFPEEWLVHSMNPIGKENIEMYIINALESLEI